MSRVFTITEGLQNLGALKTGGQGSVYKARRMGEIFSAVKLLPTPIHSEDPSDKNYMTFQNEVQKLRKVNAVPNPNVVKILSSGLTDTGSLPFIEMEFIEGPDLEELLRPPHEPVFTIKEAIRVAEHLSNALAHCHKLDVKHGDIKSNNVKYNIHTGNYMLLDFGLAVMSDEQRRTSFRQAGAIEFMAPEQTEGKMLFQTDVYSFGVILFELLAGEVPFPLADNNESSRNAVRLAHLETRPPDLLALRRSRLSERWSEEKKAYEMQVPDWLLRTIYRCLEKKIEHRFANGQDLHEYIVQSSIATTPRNETVSEELRLLRMENERLVREKTELQQQLQRARTEAPREQRIVMPPPDYEPPRRRSSGSHVIAIILTALVVGGISYFVLQSQREKLDPIATPANSTPAQPTTVGQFKVGTPKTYFHDEPDSGTRRNAYLNGGSTITGLKEENGFIYIEFTNTRGQTSKGWIRRDHLLTEDEWNSGIRSVNLPPPPVDPAVERLREARDLVAGNRYEEALAIYNTLAAQNVPEAMYMYANLTLKGHNPGLDCNGALVLLERAAGTGYAPARRTLGYLLIYSENPQVLAANGYDRCSYPKDVPKGKLLLTQAERGGDTLARRLLQDIEAQQDTMQ